MPVKKQRLQSSLSTDDVARVVHGAIRRLGSMEYGWEAAWTNEAPHVRAALRDQVKAIRAHKHKTAAEIRKAQDLEPMTDLRAACVEELIVNIVRALEPITWD